MNPDGSNPRQVTTELVPVGEYDVASDGRTIVYAVAGLVKRMRFDGADAVTLTDADRFEYGPVLAPDGSAVLVGRRDALGTDLGYWVVPLPGAPSGSVERPIVPAGAPPVGSVSLTGDGLSPGPGGSPWSRRAAFDPSGRWLVVAAGDRVFRVDLEVADPGPLIQDMGLSGSIGAPVWDATSASFLISGTMATGSGLVRIPLTGASSFVFPASGPVAVAVHGGVATLVAPDGVHLGYAALGSQPPEALTSAADVLDRSPAFSPDGTTLLFGRVLAADPSRSAGIWLAGLDGRDLRQLATDGADARWLP
jgi:Tol biopolymer transport system component